MSYMRDYIIIFPTDWEWAAFPATVRCSKYCHRILFRLLSRSHPRWVNNSVKLHYTEMICDYIYYTTLYNPVVCRCILYNLAFPSDRCHITGLLPGDVSGSQCAVSDGDSLSVSSPVHHTDICNARTHTHTPLFVFSPQNAESLLSRQLSFMHLLNVYCML